MPEIFNAKVIVAGALSSATLDALNVGHLSCDQTAIEVVLVAVVVYERRSGLDDGVRGLRGAGPSYHRERRCRVDVHGVGASAYLGGVALARLGAQVGIAEVVDCISAKALIHVFHTKVGVWSGWVVDAEAAAAFDAEAIEVGGSINGSCVCYVVCVAAAESYV